MKAKKFLALVLALVMALSCMSLTALAEEATYSKDITVNIPEITVGSTADDIKKGITLDEETANDIEVVNAWFSADGETPFSSVETAGEYFLVVVFKIKDTNAYTSFEIVKQHFYANTVNFNGKNLFTNFCDLTASGYQYNDIVVNGFPCPYLLSAQTFEIAENDGNNDYDAILDLEESTAYPDHTTIDQLYDVSVTEKRTDVTKVQVSWKLDNIQASVTSNKIWDTEKLVWVDDTDGNSAEAEPVTAKFTFENRSSVAIDAQVTFAEAEGFAAPEIAFTDNDETENADGIITLGTKAYGDGEIKGTITVTVTPVAEDFAKLTENATDKKYGTYTVTIRQLPTPN